MTTGPTPSVPRLGDLAWRHVVAVAPARSVVEAAQAMRDHDVGCLVVADAGQRPTVVTERDVTMAVANGRDLHGSVRTITGAEPLTLPTETSALDAAMALLRTGLWLVVVTSEDSTVGIVTAHDVMAALAEAVVPERLFLIAVRRSAIGRSAGGR